MQFHTCITHIITGLPVAIDGNQHRLFMDCTIGLPEEWGPRFWLERGVNKEGQRGWKLLVQPDGENPTFCVFIPDSSDNPVAQVYGEHDPAWPVSI